MLADDLEWIAEVFLTPFISLKGEVVRIAEVDSIAGKSQGTNRTIRALIGIGTSLEKLIMLLLDNSQRIGIYGKKN